MALRGGWTESITQVVFYRIPTGSEGLSKSLFGTYHPPPLPLLRSLLGQGKVNMARG